MNMDNYLISFLVIILAGGLLVWLYGFSEEKEEAREIILLLFVGLLIMMAILTVLGLFN